jgi:hypothetical protein
MNWISVRKEMRHSSISLVKRNTTIEYNVWWTIYNNVWTNVWLQIYHELENDLETTSTQTEAEQLGIALNLLGHDINK